MPEGGGHLQGQPELTRYARVRRAGPLLFVAGISSRQPDNSIKGAGRDRAGSLILDVRAQTEAAIDNLQRVLEGHGASLADVVDLTVFLTSMSDYRAFNEVYNGFFTASLPARTTVGVQQLPDPALCVELKAIAYRPQPEE
ncbi:MAG TPA: RidA family protein [Myxococcota bacterium]|nr:RidA family protein [Myxococcota bacterium]